VVSIPLALVLEGVTGFASPGARMMSYLLPPHGLRDFERSFVLSITLDSAFCFAVLVGVSCCFPSCLWRKGYREASSPQEDHFDGRRHFLQC
jgi:hypothetical protein